MNEKKKKQGIFSKHGGFIVLTVAISLAVITLVMNLVISKEDPKPTDLSEQSMTALEPQIDEPESRAANAAAIPTSRGSELAPLAPDDQETQPTATQEEPQTSETVPSDSTADFLMQPPLQGEIVKDYSADELVYFETMQDWRVHEGIDFKADIGTEVFAAADGTVIKVTEDGMLGASVTLKHANGLETLYANLEEGSAPTVGTALKTGEPLGKVGQTATLEINDGTHLHFAVIRDGTAVDPHLYIKTW